MQLMNTLCFVCVSSGTLTEQGLDLQTIVQVVSEADKERSGSGSDPVDHTSSPLSASFRHMVSDFSVLPESLKLLLASCHGLARMTDGALVGDPLDQKLFQATRWELLEDNEHRHMEGMEVPGRGAEGEAEAIEAHTTSVRPPGSTSQVFDIIKRCGGEVWGRGVGDICYVASL